MVVIMVVIAVVMLIVAMIVVMVFTAGSSGEGDAGSGTEPEEGAGDGSDFHSGSGSLLVRLIRHFWKAVLSQRVSRGPNGYHKMPPLRKWHSSGCARAGR